METLQETGYYSVVIMPILSNISLAPRCCISYFNLWLYDSPWKSQLTVLGFRLLFSFPILDLRYNIPVMRHQISE